MDQKDGAYILQSTKNQRYYIGSTNNLERRLSEHARGLVPATKALRNRSKTLFIAKLHGFAQGKEGRRRRPDSRDVKED